ALVETPPSKRSGYRQLGGNKLFYLARPLIMTDASCLDCHGRPENAPQPLINTYGDQNGFGWQLDEIVATQMVYIPADIIFERGRQNLFTVAKTLLSIFGALFITINLLLWRNVIRPLNTLTKTANQISRYSTHPTQSPPATDPAITPLTRRRDEPGQLARAFQYMLQVLEQREQDLQQAVAERTQSLEKEMRDRQTAQDALQIYSHAMSHDLQNLVVGISNVVRATLFCATQRPVDNGPKDAAVKTSITMEPQTLTMIQQSCDRQLQLMNSLIEVPSADIWRIALKPDSVKLHQLTEKITDFYTSQQFSGINSLSNQISPHLPQIQGDSNQLRRVFENLITNACKYNPDGTDITLTATIWDRDASMVRCAVIDNGVGIDPNKSQELFKIYARGNADASQAGYGLGLYICRQIITAHGGDMGVETPPNGGAAFWFTLPTVEPA
ncbi:MAG: ATP-binding protein, partial [Cyanobacteria bacterium J06642_11]